MIAFFDEERHWKSVVDQMRFVKLRFTEFQLIMSHKKHTDFIHRKCCAEKVGLCSLMHISMKLSRKSPTLCLTSKHLCEEKTLLKILLLHCYYFHYSHNHWYWSKPVSLKLCPINSETCFTRLKIDKWPLRLEKLETKWQHDKNCRTYQKFNSSATT